MALSLRSSSSVSTPRQAAAGSQRDDHAILETHHFSWKNPHTQTSREQVLVSDWVDLRQCCWRATDRLHSCGTRRLPLRAA